MTNFSYKAEAGLCWCNVQPPGPDCRIRRATTPTGSRRDLPECVGCSAWTPRVRDPQDRRIRLGRKADRTEEDVLEQGRHHHRLAAAGRGRERNRLRVLAGGMLAGNAYLLAHRKIGQIRREDIESAGLLVRGHQSVEAPEPGRRMDGQLIDKEKVSAALQELAAEHARSPRSQTARLREVLDDVEAALTAGASHAAVLATLHAQGFTFTLRSFESTLGRLRKERQADS